MNIHLKAELKGEFCSGNKKFDKTLCEKFDCWQTPTVVTKEILKSSDKLKSYSDWVKSNSSISETPIFATDDPFELGEPIGFEEYDTAFHHLRELYDFIEYYKDWEIIWFEL
jgi:hypothetical protein